MDPLKCSDPEYCGWSVVGTCKGTLSPTLSPTSYVGSCQFNKCIKVGITETTTVLTCQGLLNCSCEGTGDNVCTKTVDTTVTACTQKDVLNFSTSTTYQAGDVVRVETKRFKCKGFPFTNWCSRPGYEPLVGDFWREAWDEDGTCSQDDPTAVTTTGLFTISGLDLTTLSDTAKELIESYFADAIRDEGNLSHGNTEISVSFEECDTTRRRMRVLNTNEEDCQEGCQCCDYTIINRGDSREDVNEEAASITKLLSEEPALSSIAERVRDSSQESSDPAIRDAVALVTVESHNEGTTTEEAKIKVEANGKLSVNNFDPR